MIIKIILFTLWIKWTLNQFVLYKTFFYLGWGDKSGAWVAEDTEDLGVLDK